MGVFVVAFGAAGDFFDLVLTGVIVVCFSFGVLRRRMTSSFCWISLAFCSAILPSNMVSCANDSNTAAIGSGSIGAGIGTDDG